MAACRAAQRAARRRLKWTLAGAVGVSAAPLLCGPSGLHLAACLNLALLCAAGLRLRAGQPLSLPREVPAGLTTLMGLTTLYTALERPRGEVSASPSLGWWLCLEVSLGLGLAALLYLAAEARRRWSGPCFPEECPVTELIRWKDP